MELRLGLLARYLCMNLDARREGKVEKRIEDGREREEKDRECDYFYRRSSVNKGTGYPVNPFC